MINIIFVLIAITVAIYLAYKFPNKSKWLRYADFIIISVGGFCVLKHILTLIHLLIPLFK